MKRKTLKKALSAFLSLLMCMMTLLSISTPVFAATTVDAYMVDFPRDGDSNYSATAWGHSATSLMGGWRFLNSKYTTVHSIGTSIRFAARSAPIIIPWPPACRVTQRSPASAHEALAAHAAMNSNTTARDIP